MKVLIDTPVWSKAFRRRKAKERTKILLRD
jgi:hypothetical protein